MNAVFGTKKIVLLVLFLLLALGLAPLAKAETEEELRSKIDVQNSEIRKLEAEIAEYTRQLNETSAQASTLSSDIKKIDLTRKKLLTDISVTQNKIATRNLNIKQYELEISRKTDSIEQSKLALKEGIKKMYEKDQVTLVEAMLSSQNISDAWKEVDELRSFHVSVRDHMEDLAETRVSLEKSITSEQKVKNELVGLKTDLGDQKKIVDQNVKEKNQLLTATKNQESNYKAILAQKKALKDSLQKEISDYESKLKFILDPKTLPTGAVFSWPLSSVYVTQRFGITSSSGRLYASGSHNGADFRAATGTPVMAMADGVVLGAGDTDLTCKGASFGRWVFIKYNNGLSSTYGHLSLIKVTEGQAVTRGQIVGYSGNTGYSTGPHLHVSVYASDAVKVSEMPSKTCAGRIYRLPFAAQNAYLDPFKYLPALNGNVPL